MKNIICILLCLSLCLCLFGCGDRKETDTDISKGNLLSGNQLIGKDITGSVGDTVEVVFKLSKDVNIAAADFLIEYDSSVLEYVETKQIYKLKGGFINGNSPSAGIVKTALVTLLPPNNGGDLFSISFKVLKECKNGSEVKLTCSSCCDSDYKDIELDCKGAKVFSK